MPEFNTARLVDVIRTHDVSVIDVVPSIFALLLRESGFADLTSLRAAFFGGAPMPSATVDALRTRHPQLRLFNIYGMTETAGLITALPDADFAERPDSVGRAVPGTEVRLAADGELLVRGPTVTAGYWRDAAATDAAMRDGWLHTGDIARIDEDDYVYVLDRRKDMINRGGVKVYPIDVEHALASHPQVVEAVAFGLPDDIAGVAVAVCVVTVEGATVRAEERRAWVRDRLPVHARPRHVRIVDRLPRNPTGKVDRRALRDLFA